jgi:hypothetical protein
MMYISLSLSPNVPSKLYRSIEEQDGGRERTKERKKLAAFVCRRNKRVRLHLPVLTRCGVPHRQYEHQRYYRKIVEIS